jgi:rhodanese-related sulfurtransferase
VGHISVDELAEGFERREVVVLDLRDTDRFAAGHIPGSWPVAVMGLPARLRDPDDGLGRQLIGLGRGGPGGLPRRVCVVCDDDVLEVVFAMLEEVGLEASVVAGGVRAWSAAGRPLNRIIGGPQ